MTSSALFGASSGPKPVLEFRAGKCTIRPAGPGEPDNKKLIQPDSRKGSIYVQRTDDGIVHLYWKPRNSHNPEDDFMLFAEDAVWKKLEPPRQNPNPNERLYILQFKNGRKSVFWMQEPHAEKDTDLSEKLNQILMNPDSVGSGAGGHGGAHGGLAAALAGLGGGLGGGQGMDSLFPGVDQDQLMQLLLGGLPPETIAGSGLGGGGSGSGGAGGSGSSAHHRHQHRSSRPASAVPSEPSTARSGSSAAGSARGTNFQLSDLQRIMANLAPTETTTEARTPVDLADVLNAENLGPLDESLLADLLPQLPPVHSAAGEQAAPPPPSTAAPANPSLNPEQRAELLRTVRSPQFQQAVSSFGQALNTAQLGPLLSQFGVPAPAANAAALGDIETFARALEEAEHPTPAPAAPQQQPAASNAAEPQTQQTQQPAPGDKKDQSSDKPSEKMDDS